MLAIEIEYLMGRSVATHRSERNRAEWPPHPQRLFSALVATNAELELGPAGEQALRWLETLPPPEICADLKPSYRDVHSHYVPVNDEPLRRAKGRTDLRHPLDRRSRQERFFPAAVPANPVVVFQWPSTHADETHRPAIRRLVENLCYFGHSSSPVRACLRDVPARASLVPRADGEYALRVPGSGRFDRLNAVHELRLRDASVQPPLGRFEHYGSATSLPKSHFSSQAVVLAFGNGPRLTLESTLPLMKHFRRALLARLPDPIPEVISGHGCEGAPSTDPHLAMLPMAFVDRKFADGAIKGVALVLPQNCESSIRRDLDAALRTLWQLHLGPLGSITVKLIEPGLRELSSLDAARYASVSDSWASITPVVLDRFPKKKYSVGSIVADACERVGLPRPIEVRTGSISALSGAPGANDFHGQAKQIDGRLRRHVILKFSEPVRGPMLLGSGRFVGLGVCLPYSE